MDDRDQTLDDILHQGAWLRSLARRLVTDVAERDDVVQQVWIEALQKGRAARALRPWLFGVARNIARTELRRDTHRRAREHASAPTATPPRPDELVERVELEREVAAALLELAEPYRSTLLLRYYEDLSPSEIARRLDIRAGTVRWRLKQGLELLRANLDRRFNGDRRRWAIALVPSAATARLALPKVGLATLGGALLMKLTTKVAAALIIVLLFAVGGIALFRHRSGSVRAVAATPSAHSAGAVPARHTGSARPMASLRLPTATTHPALTGASGFGGVVRSTATEQPVPRASLTFLHSGVALSTESDASGRFDLDAPEPGTYELQSATAPGFAPFAAELGHSPVAVTVRPGVRVDDVTIYLGPAWSLTVRVERPDGAPIAGAEVRAFDSNRGPADATPFRTDAKGEAQLTVPAGVVVEARKPGYRRTATFLSPPAAATHRMTLTLTPGAATALGTIRGHVVDGRGGPVDGALVEAWTRSEDDDLDLGVPRRAEALAGADGRFTLAALPPGQYVVRASARGQGSAQLRDVALGAADVELRLGAPAAGIRGRVSDGNGKPAVAFTIVAWQREGVLGNAGDTEATVIDPQGRYELSLPPGRYQVSAAARGLAPSDERAVEVADAPVEVDFTLDPGSRIFGRVVEREGGAPIAGATVAVEGDRTADGVTLMSSATTDGDGGFNIDGRRAGLTSLEAQAPGHNGRILGALVVPANGALGPLTIDLSKVAPGQDPKIELVGIGAMLAATPTGMLVKSLTPSGGADDAGLKPGDVILAIDGQPVTAFVAALQLIRGPEGSVVVLTVRRVDGTTATLPVTRKRINY